MAIKVDHKVDLLFKKFLAGKGHRVWSGTELAPGSETIIASPSFRADQVWNRSGDIPTDRNPLNGDATQGTEAVVTTGLGTGRISKLTVDGADIYEKIVIPMQFQAGSLQSWAYDWENDGDSSADDLNIAGTGGRANVIPDSFSSDPTKFRYELGTNPDAGQALAGNFTLNIAPGEKDFFFDTDALIVNFFGLDDAADPSTVQNYFGGDNTGQAVNFLEGGSLGTGDTLYVICYRYIGPLGVGSTQPVLSSTWVIDQHTPTSNSVGAIISTGYSLPSDPVGEVEISLNGISVSVGVGEPFFFSNDGGTTQIASGSETTGDTLYFNPTATGSGADQYEIETSDEVEIRYLNAL